MPLSETLHRNITFAAQSNESETVTFQGVEHLVVPVTALVGGVVIRPHGSQGPELVPASVLSHKPRMWNQRPITFNHPSDGNKLISARQPSVLDKYAFGTVFYASFANNGLKFRLYLNKERAEVVGAMDLYNDALQHKVIGVSVGCSIRVREETGISELGEEYGWVWEEITDTDHLALLPAGYIGACNTGDGCGVWLTTINNKELYMNDAGTGTESGSGTEATTPDNGTVEESNTAVVDANSSAEEVVEAAPATAEEVTELPTSQEIETQAWEQFRNDRIINSADLRAAALGPDGGIGLWELWAVLSEILYNIEPAYGSIQEVYLGSQTVVYSTYREAMRQLWRRSFEISETWQVSVSSEIEEVQIAESYENIQEVQMSDKDVPGVNRRLTIRPASADNTAANAAATNPPTTLNTRQASTAPCTCAQHRAAAGTVAIPAEDHATYLRVVRREAEREAALRTALISNIVAAGTGETDASLRGLTTQALESMDRLLRADYSQARLANADNNSASNRDGYSKLRTWKQDS